MKILDLGAHDGFLSSHVARQVGLDNVYCIDGVELNSHGVGEFNRRMADLGVKGTCRQGRAEDAPSLLQPGVYDVVVAFELIEHVPDVDEFLDACEQMLAPDGRIYLSTPDGVFGAGDNPHHLRALRAIDLADLIRRRGTLRDMTVGSDGVTVLSYQPRARREDVAIYLGKCWQTWSPTDIETKGLGGSETAAVRLATALADRGHVVTVYGDTSPTCLRDVIFRPHWAFDPLERRDVLIASRIPEVADRPLNARLRMLWLHDTDCGERLTTRRAEAFDHVLTLSRWHHDHVAGMYPFLREQGKLRRIRNGIHLPYFADRGDWADRPQRVVYSSSPDRGLDVLLELWPQIRAQVPDAELWSCYPDVYDAVADQNPEVAAHRDRIRQLERQDGVVRLGGLAQPKLAQLLCESRVWAHPSWHSMGDVPFHETSCIGAMEAQAAGCRVVTSAWGALTETVQVGARINGGPGSPGWRQGLADEIVRGLTDPEVGEHATTLGPRHAATLGWDGVAGDIEALAGVLADTR